MQIANPTHTDCPECGGTEFETDKTDGVVVCETCHAVIEERLIDHGPEWRSFQDDETNSARTGAPITPTRHDRGLSTKIGRYKDGQGNKLSASQRNRIERMRWMEEREGIDKHDQTLRFAFGEINRMTSTLDLPGVVHSEACQIFREAKSEGLLEGWSIEGIASSAVALAAKNHTIFRSYDEIGSVSRVDVRRIERAYLKLNRELELEIEPVTPLDHFSQVMGRAENVATDDLRSQIGPLARDMLVAAQDNNLHIGKNPAAYAAASIYAASHDVFESPLPITQEEVGGLVDICAVTVRNQYREILEHWNSVEEDTETENHTDGCDQQNKTEIVG